MLISLLSRCSMAINALINSAATTAHQHLKWSAPFEAGAPWRMHGEPTWLQSRWRGWRGRGQRGGCLWRGKSIGLWGSQEYIQQQQQASMRLDGKMAWMVFPFSDRDHVDFLVALFCGMISQVLLLCSSQAEHELFYQWDQVQLPALFCRMHKRH